VYKLALKPILDISTSSIIFLILFPVFILTFFVLLLQTNGKPFFVQKRPGKNRRIFKIIKFKSMNEKKDAKGNLLPNKERITAFGRFIRKASIDEIPQLFNVIKGDMSLIGPRPLKVDYLSLYSEQQNRRHEVKPGITGWAQVNGRNAITHTRKFELDVWYVDHINFWLDIKILFLTALKVFKSEGVGKNGVNNNKPFDGAN
jgi:lipopolysaccharide/colanic/teichoic acid biosynthesis glycosyltransferase